MNDLLQAGLENLDLDATPSLCSACLTYVELLNKWNKTYNLTAIKQPEEMLTRHVLDSLSVYPYIKGNYCIDVGTGAGLPGLILAIAQPARHWVLLDSNQKKLRFIQHVKAKLNIKNVDIVHARVESFQPDDTYDSVICRAYTSLHDFYLSCRHLVKVGGELLAMKAELSEEELSAVKSLVNSVVIKKLTVPNIEATRSLVIMSD